MHPLWSWLRRKCAASRPVAALVRSPRLSRISFETLEDRLAPAAALSHDVWRTQRFKVNDAVVASPTPLDTVSATPLANQSFGSLIGLDQVFANSSLRGTGYSVAVLDTGIDYTHPDLGGGWGNRVIAGWDFVNNDADPMDDNGHGTHVAGIIGSSNAVYAGVAPNVNLIALKVLGADGSGSYGSIEDALTWVLANRTRYNIVSINLSLGSGNYTADPFDYLEGSFSALKSQGVFISAAAGNSYYTYSGQMGLAFPGVSPNVVSVGAVWDGDFGPMAWGSGARDNTTAPDRIASFSQRSESLGILAPGAMITSTYLGGGFRAMAGTSMASPVIAGAAALLHQALDAAGKSGLANQDSILALMKSTGVRIVDGDDENDNVVNTGLAFQRLNLFAAMQAVGTVTSPTTPTVPTTPVNAAPALTAIANKSLTPGGTFTIGLTATDPNGDAIAFSARVIGLPSDPNQAYALKQSLGLYALNSYFTNIFGLSEKWLGGKAGAFYVLLPSGELRHWAGTNTSTMSAANLIATLDAIYYNDPTLLLSAQPGTPNPLAVGVASNQLTVSATASATGSYQIEVTASDGRLSSTTTFAVALAAAATPNRAPVWTAIADRRISPKQGSLAVTLAANDPDGNVLTFSAHVTGASNVGVAIVGNRLTLTPPTGYLGTFAVDVTASDGQLTTTTTFHVTVNNAPPTLTLAGQITASVGATRVNIPYAAADADGDALTVTAQATVAGGSSQAASLKAMYKLTYAGSYFWNAYGLGEKWLKSADGLAFYCLLPNGELHKFTGSVASLTTAATLIASLDVSFFTDPSKLWNAAPAAGPRVTATVANGQVSVTLLDPFRGNVSVDVTVSDGLASAKKTVVVTFP